MEWMAFVVGFVFAAVGLGCLLLVVLGLPGTWVMLALAVAVELTDGRYLAAGAPPTFGWWTLGACAALAFGAELSGICGITMTVPSGNPYWFLISGFASRITVQRRGSP